MLFDLYEMWSSSASRRAIGLATTPSGPLEAQPKPVLVNLGCGGRFHPDWLNLDLIPVAPGVRRANFLAGIPLPDASADAIYHSHVLEHLEPASARDFLVECRRVLRVGGTLRVVVPDLEQSVRDYIAALDALRLRTPGSSANHYWMIVELIDQLARVVPGGEFVRFAKQCRGNDDFVVGRLGLEGPRMLALARSGSGEGRIERLSKLLDRWLPGRLGRAACETVFRTRGEVHKWMYDEPALAGLLMECGFTHANRVTAHASRIAGWTAYQLDAGGDGTVWKPVSLYMEANRP